MTSSFAFQPESLDRYSVTYTGVAGQPLPLIEAEPGTPSSESMKFELLALRHLYAGSKARVEELEARLRQLGVQY